MRELGRLLSFRATAEDYARFGAQHLRLALLLTWLVGMGRWWDDPRANMVQKLGVGSLLYVLFLALVIYGVTLPLRPRRWSYVHVLTFVPLLVTWGVAVAAARARG